MTSTVGRVVGSAVLAATLFGLSACTQPEDPPATSPTLSPPSVTSRPSPNPSPTAATTSPAQENLDAAQAAVAQFWKVVDRLSTDPKTSLKALTTVSRGTVAAQWAQNITQYRSDEVRQTGNVTVRDSLAKKTTERDVFDVAACIDVSKVNLIDKKGKSVVAASRPPRVQYRYTVERDVRKWFVTKESAVGTC